MSSGCKYLLGNNNAHLLGAPTDSEVIILWKVEIIEILPVCRKVNVKKILVMVMEEKKAQLFCLL